jgi:hypothetical protein
MKEKGTITEGKERISRGEKKVEMSQGSVENDAALSQSSSRSPTPPSPKKKSLEVVADTYCTSISYNFTPRVSR